VPKALIEEEKKRQEQVIDVDANSDDVDATANLATANPIVTRTAAPSLNPPVAIATATATAAATAAGTIATSTATLVTATIPLLVKGAISAVCSKWKETEATAMSTAVKQVFSCNDISDIDMLKQLDSHSWEDLLSELRRHGDLKNVEKRNLRSQQIFAKIRKLVDRQT
jgi:hypothetical protein